MRFLEEWTSVYYFLSIEDFDLFGDIEKLTVLSVKHLLGVQFSIPFIKEVPLYEVYGAGGRFRMIFGFAFDENPAWRAWPLLTRLDETKPLTGGVRCLVFHTGVCGRLLGVLGSFPLILGSERVRI
jgi:hypothetical protein